MNGPVAARLPGDRLHLQHGPIDLVIGAEGAREAAFAAAWARFRGILPELVAELPALRQPVGAPVTDVGGGRAPVAIVPRTNGATMATPRDICATMKDETGFKSPVARWMVAACLPHLPAFVTPMAAVAGAVAQEVLAAMVAAGPLARAWVNNGGDIALHLAPGTAVRLAIAAPDGMALGLCEVTAGSAVRGVATSGRGGRSHSLGIADAVTVLASTAAAADVAATMIGNAVDLPGHPAVLRARACDLAPDSDLGARLVTTGLGALTPTEVAQALDRGRALAAGLQARGLIVAAALFLRGQSVQVGQGGPVPQGGLIHA